jgi:chaperonin GroES
MTRKKGKKLPKPFGSYVVVLPTELIRMSAGGIAIPYADEERTRGGMTEGTVVAIGPLAFKDDLNPSGVPWYEVGDRVIFVKYGGKAIKYDGEVYNIFRYEDVLCGLDQDTTFSEDVER